MVYSDRLVSPYSYLVFSSPDVLAAEVEQDDASEGIDEKSEGLFPPLEDERDLAWFFVLRALKQNFSIFFDI